MWLLRKSCKITLKNCLKSLRKSCKIAYLKFFLEKSCKIAYLKFFFGNSKSLPSEVRLPRGRFPRGFAVFYILWPFTWPLWPSLVFYQVLEVLEVSEFWWYAAVTQSDPFMIIKNYYWKFPIVDHCEWSDVKIRHLFGIIVSWWP